MTDVTCALAALARDALTAASLAEADDIDLLIDRVAPAAVDDPAVLLIDLDGEPAFLCERYSRVPRAAATDRAAILRITDGKRGCRVSFVGKLALSARCASLPRDAPRLVTLAPRAILLDLLDDDRPVPVPIAEYFDTATPATTAAPAAPAAAVAATAAASPRERGGINRWAATAPQVRRCSHGSGRRTQS